jgi:hypothetical protein
LGEIIIGNKVIDSDDVQLFGRGDFIEGVLGRCIVECKAALDVLFGTIINDAGVPQMVVSTFTIFDGHIHEALMHLRGHTLSGRHRAAWRVLCVARDRFQALSGKKTPDRGVAAETTREFCAFLAAMHRTMAARRASTRRKVLSAYKRGDLDDLCTQERPAVNKE